MHLDLCRRLCTPKYPYLFHPPASCAVFVDRFSPVEPPRDDHPAAGEAPEGIDHVLPAHATRDAHEEAQPGLPKWDLEP